MWLNIDFCPISSFSFPFSSFSLVERPLGHLHKKTAYEISVLLLHGTVFLCNKLPGDKNKGNTCFFNIDKVCD